jgi:hypothetical protein
MKIELDLSDEFVDNLMEKVLVDDYVGITSDLKKNKKIMHEDDIKAYKNAVKGIELLSNWYFARGEFDRLVKKVRNNEPKD